MDYARTWGYESFSNSEDSAGVQRSVEGAHSKHYYD